MKKPKIFKDFELTLYDDKSGWSLRYGLEDLELGGKQSIICGWKSKHGLRHLINLRNYLNKVIKYLILKQAKMRTK